MGEKVLMLGNEAIARGAYEAGVKVSAAYPGTPSTEISENIVKYKEIYCEWSPNEKVAMEVAIGASFGGVRSMASMKHVGLNVAADPLYSFSYIGVGGGLVTVVADDPGLYSSQNEQDTRMIGRAAGVPVLEPSDSAEAKEFVKFAYEMSEKYDTPVILRTTTRLAHSQGLVELNERKEIEDKPYERNIAKNVMMPGNAKVHHVIVEERNNRIAKEAKDFPINKVILGNEKVGVITSGIPYQYVKEAMPGVCVLKLGIVNPLPKELIEDFAKHVDKLYIVEELEPVIEEQVKAMGIKCIGKEIFTIQGEYSANMIRKALKNEKVDIPEPKNVPARPPILCPGCPHRSTYSVMKKLKLHAMGDIGCYTLGAVAPLAVVDTTVCMGSSISTLHGLEKAKRKDYIKDWVAVIGDSTFMHTGVNSLMNMVYNNSTATVVILDNSTTGMTGHQDNPATGKTLMGETTYLIDIPTLCKGMGVKHVVTVNSFDVEKLEAVLKEELKRDELSVIISKYPCALLDKTPITRQCKIIPDKCKKCGMCMQSGCPAISKNSDGSIVIDDTMCNGCGLCKNSCKFGAIQWEDKK